MLSSTVALKYLHTYAVSVGCCYHYVLSMLVSFRVALFLISAMITIHRLYIDTEYFQNTVLMPVINYRKYTKGLN